MNEKYYTVDQISNMLNLHPKTIRRYIREGKLRANKVGKSWLVTGHDLSIFTEGSNVSKRTEAKTYRIKISAVADIDVYDMDEAMDLVNMLTASLNCKPAEYGMSTMSAQFIETESKVRIMLYGNVEFMEAMMGFIAAYNEKGEGE